MNKINDLEKAIKEFDLKFVSEKSKNLFVLNEINEACLSIHQKNYLALEAEEKPLLALNGKKSLIAKLIPFSGLVITNKKIHFSLLKRSFLTGIYPFRVKIHSLNLESIDSFQIGEHDACYGTAYVGHDLRINNQTLGLVRLGFAIEYDEKALNYINELSKYLFENGFLSSEPKEFKWQ